LIEEDVNVEEVDNTDRHDSSEEEVIISSEKDKEVEYLENYLIVRPLWDWEKI